jgi:hypothetical protein
MEMFHFVQIVPQTGQVIVNDNDVRNVTLVRISDGPQAAKQERVKGPKRSVELVKEQDTLRWSSAKEIHTLLESPVSGEWIPKAHRFLV